MSTFITILIVLACFILNVAVLLQPSQGTNTALGGSSQSVFGSTGGTTFLFRLTNWSAAFIMAGCLYITRHKIEQARSTVLDTVGVSSSAMPPPAAAQVPNVPSTPAETGTNATHPAPGTPGTPASAPTK